MASAKKGEFGHRQVGGWGEHPVNRKCRLQAQEEGGSRFSLGPPEGTSPTAPPPGLHRGPASVLLLKLWAGNGVSPHPLGSRPLPLNQSWGLGKSLPKGPTRVQGLSRPFPGCLTQGSCTTDKNTPSSEGPALCGVSGRSLGSRTRCPQATHRPFHDARRTWRWEEVGGLGQDLGCPQAQVP